MGKKRRDGGPAARSAVRIKVCIPKQDEAFMGWRAEFTIQKQVPESDFIMVPASVAVFRPVEDGGRCMEGQQVDPSKPRHLDRHHPMPARGKSLYVERCGGGKGGAVDLWRDRTRQVHPAKRGEIPQVFRNHRMSRKDRHRARPEKLTVALRIARAALSSISVEVEIRGKARVRSEGEAVRVIRPAPFDNRLGERVQRGTLQIIVDALKNQHIRRGGGYDPDDGIYLSITAPLDIAQQKPGARARKLGIVGGDPKRFRRSGQCRP